MVSLPVIPLARDATGRALPIVLAILVLLGMLLLTAALSVGTFFTTWESSVSGKATIQVMPLDDKTLPLAERVADVLHIVRSEAAIKKAEEVSPAAMQGLLAPWLGQEVDLASLPVPALIALEHTNAVNFDQIRKDLSEVAGVSVDDYASWLKTLRQALMMASIGMYGLVGLVLVSIVLIVFLLVRARMGQHVDVIELLQWKKNWQPVTVGRFHIAPPWKDAPPDENLIVIRIEPGMAFGTGTHVTTKLCLAAIEKYYAGGSFLDVGTGTGILSVPAAKLYPAEQFEACDTDAASVAIARENAVLSAALEILKTVYQQVYHDSAEDKFDLVLESASGFDVQRYTGDNDFGWTLKLNLELSNLTCE